MRPRHLYLVPPLPQASSDPASTVRPLTDAAHAFEAEFLSPAALALLDEIRALTATGAVYPNQPTGSAGEELLDELIHASLVEPNPTDGEGWRTCT